MWRKTLALVLIACPAAAGPAISGKVVDAAGRSVAGATVGVVPLAPTWKPRAEQGAELPLRPPLGSAASGADGTFRLDAAGIPPGLHALSVEAPGLPALLRWRERVVFGEALLPTDMEIVVPRTTTLTGLALDPAGEPARGLPLTALADGPDGAAMVSSRTDDAGHFSLVVPRASEVTLVGRSADLFGIVRTALPDAAEARLALHAERLADVTGRFVSRQTGAPLGGLKLRTMLPTWDPAAPTPSENEAPPWAEASVIAEQVTPADGSYSVRLPPSGRALVAGPHGMVTRARPGDTPVEFGRPQRGRVLDESGAPLSGVSVRWCEVQDVSVTDADGRFELPADVNAAVIAASPDGAVRVARDPAQDATIVLPRRIEVVGRVLAPADGEAPPAPAAGVTVRVVTDAFTLVTASDAGGLFRVTARGVASVSAQRGDLVATVSSLPQASEPLTLTLAPRVAAATPAQGPVLRIALTNDAGKPVEGALVRALAITPDSVVPVAAAGTDADGRALVPVRDAALLAVEITRPGLAKRAVIAPDTAAVLSLKLARGGVIRGTAHGPDGAPAPGGLVFARGEDAAGAEGPADRRLVIADGQGAFEIRDLRAGSYLVEGAMFEAGRVEPARVELQAGATATADLRLVPSSAWRGHVRDASGPVAGAKVSATLPQLGFGGGDGTLASQPRTTWTAADGSFALRGLDAEAWYDVAVTAPWHSDGRAEGRPSEAELDIVLPATGRLVVTLPADPGSYVACNRAAAGEETEDLDDAHVSERAADGSATFDEITPGTWTCTSISPLRHGRREGIVVRPGAETQAAIDTQARTQLTVAVRESGTGTPIAGADVSTSVGNAPPTGADGRTRIGLLSEWERAERRSDQDEEDPADAADEYVRVWAEGHRTASADIRPDAAGELTVELQRVSVLRGRVTDEQGAPVEGAEILEHDHPIGVTTDADGRFSMPMPGEDDGDAIDLRDPVIGARRSGPGFVDEGSVTLAKGTPPAGEIAIVLHRSRTGSVTVVVSDASGPVKDAIVDALIPGDEVVRRTDAEGRCRFDDVWPGQVILLVGVAPGAAAANRRMILKAGENAVVTVVLADPWTLEGRVVRDGRPVDGATVTWMSDGVTGFGETRSRADGTFQAGPVPADVGELELMVRAASEHRGRKVTVSRGAPDVVVDLSTVGVSGRLVGTGGPVSGAFVEMWCGDDQTTAESGEDGRFLLERAAAGASCDGFAHADNGIVATFHVDMPMTGRVDVGDVRGEISPVPGHVSGASGWVSLELVTTAGGRAGNVLVEPGADGSFLVTLPPVPVSYLARAGSATGWVQGMHQPGVPLELSFAPAARLELTCREADGSPALAGARLVRWQDIGPEDPRLPYLDGASETDGVIVLEPLGAGHVVVAVRSDGGRIEVPADVVAGQTTRIDVTVP